MKSPLRRLPAIGLVLILLATILTATQEPVRVKIYSDYGLITVAPKPTALLEMTPPLVPAGSTVQTIRGTNLMFKVAGGIMFDAVAQPCDQLSAKRLSLSYVRRPVGNQLVLRVGNKAYSIASVDDGDLRAIAEFSNDENPVLVNATPPRIEEKEEACPSPTGLLMVNAHKAFLNTRLTWLLTRMDTLPWSLSDSKRWDKKDALPASSLTLGQQLNEALKADQIKYTNDQNATVRILIAKGPSALAMLDADTKAELSRRITLGSADAWAKFEDEIVKEAAIDPEAFNALSPTDRRMLLLLGLASGSERVSNINDHESAPGFCVANSALVFDGTPRLEFFRVWYDSPRRFNSSSDLMSSNFSQLRLIDQEAYDTTMEIYNLSGLFKYVKNQQPAAEWNRFVKSLPPKERRDDIEIACPECSRDQVTKWLACLESRN
ncbi:MAG TPA: hypothetical protein VNG71_00090 [Pyrinomonadaceae bacterium]|nr:hypothetical protein [Pyrinomonadaceae bacterium]